MLLLKCLLNSSGGYMPHYEFICRKCQKTFALTMSLADHEKGRFTCPKCTSRKVEQKLSTFAAVTSKRS